MAMNLLKQIYQDILLFNAKIIFHYPSIIHTYYICHVFLSPNLLERKKFPINMNKINKNICLHANVLFD